MLRILVVDDDLPNMPGFESIRVFHQRAPTVPLIAISAFASSGARKPTIWRAPEWPSVPLGG